GDRKTILAELFTHQMRCVVDLFTDAIFPAVEKRSGLQRIAGNVELSSQLGALNHRAASSVDETGARGPHHSSPCASRSSRNAALTSSKRIRARQIARPATSSSSATTMSVARSGPTFCAKTRMAPNASASIATSSAQAAMKPHADDQTLP